MEKLSRQLKKEFVDSMIDLDSKYYEIINEKFWDLIGKDVEVREVNYAKRKRVNS